MKRTLLSGVAVLFSLSGCASVHEVMGPGWAERQDHNSDTKFVLAEAAWQGLNAIDGMQTMHIADAPECYREVGFPSQQIMGDHPDKAEVVAVHLLYAIGYRWISGWLASKEHEQTQEESREGWRTVRAAWHGLSLVTKGFVVARNHSHGLRPVGSGCR